MLLSKPSMYYFSKLHISSTTLSSRFVDKDFTEYLCSEILLFELSLYTSIILIFDHLLLKKPGVREEYWGEYQNSSPVESIAFTYLSWSSRFELM